MKFLLTADWHLKGTTPRCRTDEDWLETQRTHVRFVVDLANEHDIPLVIVGDVFDTPKVATSVVNMAISELRRANRGVFLLAGNHDLPYHSYERFQDCSLGTLCHVFPELGSPEAVRILGPHNARPFGCDEVTAPEELVFTHQLVFADDSDRPMAECGKIAEDVANEFVNARIICTGDYHTAFRKEIVRADGSRVCVVNPGCLNRQVADKLDYTCKVAIVDTETSYVKWVDVPDNAELVTDSYIREADAKSDRVEAFLELVQARGSVSLSFTENLRNRLELPQIPQSVRSEILGVLTTINSEK